MDINLESVTLAALLTTAGATIIAAFVSGMVEIIKRLVPRTGAYGIQVASFLAAVIVGLLASQAIVTEEMPVGIPLVLAVVFAWYGVTRLSMSIYDDVSANPNSLRNTGGG